MSEPSSPSENLQEKSQINHFSPALTTPAFLHSISVSSWATALDSHCSLCLYSCPSQCRHTHTHTPGAIVSTLKHLSDHIPLLKISSALFHHIFLKIQTVNKAFAHLSTFRSLHPPTSPPPHCSPQIRFLTCPQTLQVHTILTVFTLTVSPPWNILSIIFVWFTSDMTQISAKVSAPLGDPA